MLVLLRHGESTYNAAARFTGLLDVPLTDRGREQARDAAQLLIRHGIMPDVVYTSVLTRARDTARLVTATLGRSHLRAHPVWQLNERNYGALTGLARSQVFDVYGPDLFIRWRRTLTGEPPPMGWALLQRVRQQPALHALPREAVTATESLDDVRRRVAVFSRTRLHDDLQQGATVLVIAHGNSLRALCMILDDLTDAEVIALNIPTGHPLLYQFDDQLHPVRRGGRYLDPVAAHRAAQRVAADGGT